MCIDGKKPTRVCHYSISVCSVFVITVGFVLLLSLLAFVPDGREEERECVNQSVSGKILIPKLPPVVLKPILCFNQGCFFLHP